MYTVKKLALAVRYQMAADGDGSVDSMTADDLALNFLLGGGNDEPAAEDPAPDTEDPTPAEPADEGKGEGEEGEGGSDESEGEVGGETEGEAPKTEPELEEESPEPTEPELLTDEDLAERRRAYRADLEKVFAISDEDATLLVTEPESVLPRMAANMYEKVMSDVVSMMQTQIPAVMQQFQKQTESQQKTKDMFYKINPGLSEVDESQVTELIPQYAGLIRQTNPNLTQEELIRKVGMVIGAALGVDAGKVREAPPPKPKPAAQVAPAPAPSAAPVGGLQPEGGPIVDSFLTELINSTER